MVFYDFFSGGASSATARVRSPPSAHASSSPTSSPSESSGSAFVRQLRSHRPAARPASGHDPPRADDDSSDRATPARPRAYGQRPVSPYSASLLTLSDYSGRAGNLFRC